LYGPVVATVLKLGVEPNFRLPASKGGVFLGRAEEVARLRAIVEQRPAATVLVAGHRGVGKSSMVAEALDSKPAPLVVRLNLPHLDAPLSTDTVREKMLRSFAQGLHLTIRQDGKVPAPIADKALSLFEKTTMTDLTEHSGASHVARNEVVISSQRSVAIGYEPSAATWRILGAAAGGLAAAGGVGVALAAVSALGTGWGLAAFAVIALIAVVSAVRTSVTTVKIEARSTAGESKSEFSVDKVQDLSADTLEFELQDVLRQLRDQARPTVFVIDELDKMAVDATAPDLQRHPIYLILSSLKNFFTLGSGVFVFIAGDDFYRDLQAAIRGEAYSVGHTLFSDRIYLPALPHREVEDLIDAVLDRNSDAQQTEIYRQFRNYVCWQSNCHAFDVLTVLGNFVDYSDSSHPTLVVRTPGDVDGRWVEGNIPPDWVDAAGLQKVVGATYDEHARSGGYDEYNEALWLALLDVAKGLYRDKVLYTPRASYNSDALPEVGRLSTFEIEDIAGAVEKFLRRLERIGYVTRTDTQLEADDGTSDEVAQYQVVPDPPYPGTDIASHTTLTTYELALIDIARRYRRLRDSVRGQGAKIDTAREITNALSVATRTESTSITSVQSRSRVELALKSIDRAIADALTAGAKAACDRWVGRRKSWLITHVARDATEEERSLAAHKFAAIPELELVMQSWDDPFAVLQADSRPSVLVLLPLTRPERFADLSEALRHEKAADRLSRVRIVAVGVTHDEALREIASSLVPDLDDSEEDGWLGNLLRSIGATPARRLKGWISVTLDEDASNLADVGRAVDKAIQAG
jgi:hypothetical protein